ncbi:acyl carrier protein [Streptomyces sp. NPDC048362]|uniref:acyl carrier protein n=1 Tax=Streptomyces sp. NPDC048362 TaxID=3365539 RepID=UPI003724B1F9
MSTSTDAVYSALRQTLINKFDVPANEIQPGKTIGDLELDSLALAELTVVLSEELGVTVTEEGVTSASSLAEFADLVTTEANAGRHDG